MKVTIEQCSDEEAKRIEAFFKTVFPDATLVTPAEDRGIAVDGRPISVGDIVVWSSNREYLYRVAEIDGAVARVCAVAMLREVWKKPTDTHGLAGIKHYMGEPNGFQTILHWEKLADLSKADLTVKLATRIASEVQIHLK